jgi:chemotaxis protein CheD
MRVSNDPTALLVTQSMGSCIGVSVYDPESHVGGMMHSMLPSSVIHRSQATQATSRPCMFVDTGLPTLLDAVCALGAEKNRLIVTIAGAAQFLKSSPILNVAEKTASTVQDLLNQAGIQSHVVECGGQYCRTLSLDIGTGSLTLDAPGCASRML